MTEQDLEEVANELEEKVERLTEQIENEVNPSIRKEICKKRTKIKKAIKQVKEEFIPRMKKYKKQIEICGELNSYSKTDHDATFMRMEEDHMKNGQLKPGYNVQTATENQFILFYSIHQNRTDTRSFIQYMEKLGDSNLPMPKRVIADAGYGNEENYVFAVGEDKNPHFKFLIPYATFF